MFALFLIAIILISTSCDAAERMYTALKFGTTGNDYIQFSYDMSPFRSSFTLTAWIKRVSTSSSGRPAVFHYKTSSTTYEILIGPAGYFNWVLGDTVLDSLQDKFTTPPGTWFHYALSWSSSTRTIDVYHNGERVATGQTGSGRQLQMGGELWINRLGNNGAQFHVFGGQLYQLNVYSGVLTAENILEIADGGLCGLDFHSKFRSPVLRWEDILAKSRTGSVTEVTGCEFKEDIKILQRKLKTLRVQTGTVTERLNSTQDELESVTAQLNSTEQELRAQSARLNQTEDDLGKTKADLRAQSARCNQTEEELSSIKVEMKVQSARCNQTEGQLATCSSALTDTKSQLDGARKLENITQWDVLYRKPYYNNVLTEELINQTKSSWDLLRKFVGLNITNTIIKHFRKHDVVNSKCGAQTDLGDIIGELNWDKLAMVTGVVQHFTENHSDELCDD